MHGVGVGVVGGEAGGEGVGVLGGAGGGEARGGGGGAGGRGARGGGGGVIVSLAACHHKKSFPHLTHNPTSSHPTGPTPRGLVCRPDLTPSTVAHLPITHALMCTGDIVRVTQVGVAMAKRPAARRGRSTVPPPSTLSSPEMRPAPSGLSPTLSFVFQPKSRGETSSAVPLLRPLQWLSRCLGLVAKCIDPTAKPGRSRTTIPPRLLKGELYYSA